MGFGAWLLWHMRDRFRVGVLFAIYLVYAGSERFLVEFLRRNSDAALGLTAAQLESLAMIVAGVTWIFVVRRRYGSLSRVNTSATADPGVAA
jgi:phosphatidylglycerol:prolipoprotein diacylglycerol transferase